MEFVATIYFLDTEEGGRSAPIFSGYRPAFYFENQQIDGAIILNDQEHILPGEKQCVKVRMLHAESIKNFLKPHITFEIKEGLKVIGRGKILHIDFETGPEQISYKD